MMIVQSMCRQGHGGGQYLTEYGESVVRQEAVRFVHEKIATNELLEAPVFALHEPICALAL